MKKDVTVGLGFPCFAKEQELERKERKKQKLSHVVTQIIFTLRKPSF